MAFLLVSAQNKPASRPDDRALTVEQLTDPDRLRVSDAQGILATLTTGARTVAVRGPSRTFTEQKKVGAVYKDDFGRTRTSGWGLSPFYGSWSNNSGGSLTDYTVDGTAGRIHPQVTNVAHYQTLRDTVAGVDARIKTRVTTSPAGAANSISLLTGYSTTSDHNRYRVTYNSTGNITAAITKVVGGAETVLATQSNVLTGYTGGTWIWVRGQRSGPVMNMYVWADGSAEPSTPTVTATDSTFLQGRVGIRAFNSTGATNDPTYEIDELQVTAGTWPTPPAVTHNTWVRLLDEPFDGLWSPAVEHEVRRWALDRTPDVLAYGFAYVAGAPVVQDASLGVGKQVMGEAKYGPTEADGKRQEGSDFNDYITVSGDYLHLATPSTDVNELAQQYCLDCSGFVRMVFGYWLGMTMSLDDAADLNGLWLPRRSVKIMPTGGPGVIIAESVGTVPSLADIQIGDVVGFNADTADDGAGEDVEDVEETDDHVGVYVGQDADGNYLFLSSRKTANGPTVGAVGGTSHLNGSGFWAVALRHIRRF